MSSLVISYLNRVIRKLPHFFLFGCALAILAFVIEHVYMTTTGHTLTSHIATVFSGWEEVENGEVAAWEVQHKR